MVHLCDFSLGGSAEITHVYERSGVQHFLAAVIAKMLVPYHAEPFHRRVLLNKLLVVKRGSAYHLELLDAGKGLIAKIIQLNFTLNLRCISKLNLYSNISDNLKGFHHCYMTVQKLVSCSFPDV